MCGNNFMMNYPIDPACPGAKEIYANISNMEDDPMTQHYGVDVGEFADDWIAEHAGSCKRCQLFGAANCEVVGP